MKRYKRINLCVLSILLAIICSFMAFCLSGCTKKADEKGEVKYLIGMSQANLAEPWRVKMNEEIKAEASKHDDLKVIFTDAANDSNKQIDDVLDLLKEGIDLLIISPNESAALTPVVAEAYANIPVIVLDRAVEGYDYTLYIGPDNNMIGKAAGKHVAELLKQTGGNVLEIHGLKGSPPVLARSEGFREAISQHSNIKVVDSINADWLSDTAEDQVNMLKKTLPKIDVIFAQNDDMAYGAYKAMSAGGIKGIKYVGVDGLEGENGGIDLVRKGILESTFQCPTGGKEAINYAIDILNQVKGIPKKIILHSNIITKENVNKLQDNDIRTKARGNKKPVLGYALVGSESTWRLANTESIKNAAEEAGVDLRIVDCESNQKKQIDAIRRFIAQKVDVIAFSPIIETGWDDVLQEAKRAGIPVICTDRTVKTPDETLTTSFIGSDFVEEGRRAARWLESKTKGMKKVNIAELEGTLGAAPTIERSLGFDEVIKGDKKFNIVRSQSGNFTKQDGELAMESILKSEKQKIDVVFSHNDDMAFGAIEAIENYGLKPGKDIIIVSIDGVRAAFQQMIAGKMNCTVECNPLLGPQIMKAVNDYMAGKELPVKIITSEGVFPEEVAKKEIVNRKY
ncbi:MAG TPA: substrate-binding domain-containing protein [Ruminiclostridium sp.]|nr:substrate-binding domain-containing protein [Ruminiclostridium sp.]